MHRRAWLKNSLLIAALWLSTRKALAAAWFASAFEAKHTADVLAALNASAVPVASDLSIEAPQKAENGAVVQIALTSTQAAGKVRCLRLLADANPTPLIASFELGKQVLPKLVTRVKLAQSGEVIALAEQANGQFAQQRRQVIVLEDGCASSEREAPFASSMKMRARMLAPSALGHHVTELKIIIVHPMRTGRSKNEDGELMPPHFMQMMQVVMNGQVIVDAQTGTAISRNPYFTFYLEDAKIGDVITVNWQDNRGLEGHGQVTVTQ